MANWHWVYESAIWKRSREEGEGETREDNSENFFLPRIVDVEHGHSRNGVTCLSPCYNVPVKSQFTYRIDQVSIVSETKDKMLLLDFSADLTGSGSLS